MAYGLFRWNEELLFVRESLAWKIEKNRGVYNFTTPEKTKGRTITNEGGGLKYQLNFLFAADFFS